MKKIIFAVGVFSLFFMLISQSFGAIIHDYDFNDGSYGGSWNFGNGYIEDDALVFDAKNKDPYVQWKLPVNAGYDFYHFEYSMMSESLNASSQLGIFFDTPTVAVFEAFSDGSLDWRTHSPNYVRNADISSYEDNDWMKFSFDLDMLENQMAIYKDGDSIYNGHLGATSDDLQSIRFSLSLYPGWCSDDSRIFVDDVLLTGSNTAPVPEPATMLLFGTGLICLIGTRRKQLKSKK